MTQYYRLLFLLFLNFSLSCDLNLLDALNIGSGDQKVMTFRTNETGFELSVELIRNLIFLEHVYSWEYQKATMDVIGTKYGTGCIYESKDLGKNFKMVYEDYFQDWEICMTTSNGRHLVWNNNNRNIWIFDNEWKYLKQIKTGNYPWHGSAGIAEIHNTIIYAEYTNLAEKLYVWRSEDAGDSWQRVFSQNSYLSQEINIKHFHTVQPDPFFPGHWYLSSGDRSEECRVWKSADDGLSWIEVTDPDPDGTSLQSVHRYTSIHFDESSLYWGTDDIMDGKAKFVRAAKTEPLQVEVLADLGNLVRSLISTPYGLIFISEQKMIRNGKLLDMTIHLSQDKRTVLELARISRENLYQNGFTYSRASISSYDNTFFSYFASDVIFHSYIGMLKWEINIDSEDH